MCEARVLKERLEFLLPAAGAVLCTATQLRLSWMPLGLGEVLLAVWMLWVLTAHFKNGRFRPSSNTLLAFLGFWGITFILLPLSVWSGYRLGVLRIDQLVHGVLAYTFAFCVTIAMVSIPNRLCTIRWHLRWLTIFGSLVPIFLAVIAQYHYDIYGIEFWYGGDWVRFRGLSVNPNQLALLIVPLPFLILHTFVDDFDAAARGTEKFSREIRLDVDIMRNLAVALLFGLVIFAGWITMSDALRWAWLVFLSLRFGCYLVPWLAGREGFRTGLAVMICGILIASWMSYEFPAAGKRGGACGRIYKHL